MKKIMLLLAAGLFFLPSCSKEASEPIPSVQKGDEGEGTFNFSMEGVREDVLDNEGRALVLNPKASVTGNKITKINPSNGSGQVRSRGLPTSTTPTPAQASHASLSSMSMVHVSPIAGRSITPVA